MKQVILSCFFFIFLLQSACEDEKVQVDYSGIYCLNLQNIEMLIAQKGNEVTFTVQNDLLVNGVGTAGIDTLLLNAETLSSERFTAKVVFSDDLKSFSGPYSITDETDQVLTSGILMGLRGECSTYDIGLLGVPDFIESDFTQLDKIEKISKFRSGFGHSYTDGTELCRSMKHYFMPFTDFLDNNTVAIYSPCNGTITSVSNDGHGASTGLTNKVIQIRPDDQPAFICEIFHCDLVSEAIKTGKEVQAGELLGHARLYYDDLNEYANSFDIALWVQTPSGMRLISYFEAITDDLFELYISRGAYTREDFIISKEARDADPNQCDGERFLTSGTLENWVVLNPTAKYTD
jgi:hypothetical protein